MCARLRVGCDLVVLLVAHVDVSGLEALEDILDHADLLLRAAVVDDHERLALSSDTGPVKRVHADNVRVLGEVALECDLLRRLDTRLTGNSSADLRARAVLLHNSVNGRSLNTVDDQIRHT